jgi:ferric-dicitrate binding protein FerR (iron transport regulator)
MSEPTDLRDARWRNLMEQQAIGEPLSADDEGFLASYRARDPEVRTEQDLLGELRQLGADDDVLACSDDALVHGALADFDAHAPARTTTASPRRGTWIAVGGVLAAAFAALWLWPRAPLDVEVDPSPTPIADATPDRAPPGDARPAPSSAPEQPPEAPPVIAAAPLVVRSGTFVDGDGHAVPLAAAIDIGTVTAKDDACLLAGATEACFAAGSRLAISRDGDDTEITIARGRVQVRGEATVSTVVYQVAGQRVVPAAVTVFVIEVSAEGRWSVDVSKGEVRVTERGGDARTVKAGQVRAFGPRSTTTITLTAPQWLARARTARGAGDIDGAIAAYQGLIAHFPRAPAARTAMVTLAQLHLDAGHAKSALEWFERYLGKGGPLAEDAAYGRIRALRSLGRAAEERKAIDAFVTKYPAGSYAAKLRDR